tara:strand:- start:3025 stop:3954 length:930 start_codon:yes stop_codon:yes gene_type:complete
MTDSILSSDLFLSIFIILIFIGLYLINILGVGIKNIEKNWSLYRCNPLVIPFAGLFGKDIGTNFTYCIQNMQQSFMGELLQPIHYSMGVMGSIGNELTSALTAVRAFFNKIRTFITNIIQQVMGVFLNILISIQKLTIDMKDMFSKTLGIMATLLYILQGSLMTMNSFWAGPPGKLVRFLCFHPDTLVKTKNKKIVKMKKIKAGEILKNNQTVYATMNIHNLDDCGNFIEKLYSLPCGENKSPILVTGSHLIFDKSINNFIYVKDFPGATEVPEQTSNLVCLITSDHTIPLGDYIFHDWEDNNEILKKK